MKRAPTVLFAAVLAVAASAYEVRPLDWTKLAGGAGNDELAAMCATVMAHTQDDMGKDWLGKVGQTRRVGDLLDFGYVDSKRKKGRRRAMEDCIRPMTTTARTLALAIRTGQYRADKAGAEVAEIEKLLPLVIRSLAMDHKVNGGIGKDVWGDSWQSAMWAGQLAQAAWIVWDRLGPADREFVVKVLIHEADRFLNVEPPVSNKKSVEDTKGEENVWNMGCLLTASTMLRDHPHEAAWREQAIVYFLNAVATPHDVGSATVVDGKPLSERVVGYCITKDYAVGNHGAYPHPSYTASSYLGSRQIFFCTLAGVQPPEALLYNAAPIYRMFVDHEWTAPPCVAPGGTIYRTDGGIYWPVEKEKERAGRYYKWFKQDVMADTFGFDAGCSTKAAYWAKLHGQMMVDALTGKPTPAKLESYHKGAFFKNALACYLIRRLHQNRQLPAVRALASLGIGATYGPNDATPHQGQYRKNLTYQGPVTGHEIIHTLYLPPEYSKDKGPYPLIVFLHGAGGGNASSEVLLSYEAARKAGLIRDAIVVFPEKYGGTVWRDGAKDKMPETNVLKELLPYLEKEYAASDDRSQRTIMGFSMGAAGSIYWGAKYLDIFSISVALDAGGGTSMTDSSARNYVPEFAENTEAIRKSLNLRIVQGGLNTRKFREALDKLNITYDYTQLPADAGDYPEGSCCLNKKDPTRKFLHNPKCMTEGEWGRETWAFIEKHMRGKKKK